MPSVSLFRKWRSQRFQDLVGQESVVRTLQNVLLSDSPARAYLFCGPRGTGKTSSARIFAKALNCENGPGLEPCNECDQCRSIASGNSLDVFEIDAASHTQVDKIRDFIVDKVHFAPVTARVKVYIIDEVHKLSASSFNALLKTLEEPPSHVVFILATTHPHELPPTILSRCQRYDFRPLSVAEIRARLALIAESEGVELASEAGDQLARAADGSLRDALVLFEQAVTFCGERVELEPVLELLGTVGYQVMERLVMALRAREAGGLLMLLHELNAQGRDLKRLASAFLEHLRLVMLVKVKAPDSTFEQMAVEERESLERLASAVSLVDLMHWIRAGMELSAEVREGRQAKLLWELTLVRLATPSAEPGLNGLEARISALEERMANGSQKTVDVPVRDRPEKRPEPPPERAPQPEKRPEPPPARAPQPEKRPEPPLERAPQSEKRPEPSPARAPQPEKRPEPPPERAPQSEKRPEPSREAMPERGERPEAFQGRNPQREERPEAVQEPRRAERQERAPERPEPSLERAPQRSERPEAGHERVPHSGERPESRQASTPQRPESPQRKREPEAAGLRRVEPSRGSDGRAPGKKEFWMGLMNAVRDHDMRLHAVLADAKVTELGEEEVVLGLPDGYDWHRDTILKSRSVLEGLAASTLGRRVRVECRVDGAKTVRSNDEEHDELVRRASGLFAGEIVD